MAKVVVIYMIKMDGWMKGRTDGMMRRLRIHECRVNYWMHQCTNASYEAKIIKIQNKSVIPLLVD